MSQTLICRNWRKSRNQLQRRASYLDLWILELLTFRAPKLWLQSNARRISLLKGHYRGHEIPSWYPSLSRHDSEPAYSCVRTLRHKWPQAELRSLHVPHLRQILENQHLVLTWYLGCVSKCSSDVFKRNLWLREYTPVCRRNYCIFCLPNSFV
jgi:hypothetical protein